MLRDDLPSPQTLPWNGPLPRFQDGKQKQRLSILAANRESFHIRFSVVNYIPFLVAKWVASETRLVALFG